MFPLSSSCKIRIDIQCLRVTTVWCHHRLMSPPFDVTTIRCHHHSMSPPFDVTTAWCHHRSMSPPFDVTTIRCHHRLMSPSLDVTTAWCHHHLMLLPQFDQKHVVIKAIRSQNMIPHSILDVPVISCRGSLYHRRGFVLINQSCNCSIVSAP